MEKEKATGFPPEATNVWLIFILWLRPHSQILFFTMMIDFFSFLNTPESPDVYNRKWESNIFVFQMFFHQKIHNSFFISPFLKIQEGIRRGEHAFYNESKHERGQLFFKNDTIYSFHSRTNYWLIISLWLRIELSTNLRISCSRSDLIEIRARILAGKLSS